MDKLKELIDGLNFLSESDAFWQLWVPAARRPRVVNANTMLELMGRKWCVQHQPFPGFIQHVVYSQTVSQGPEVGARYEALGKYLVENLRDLQVFKTNGLPGYNLAYWVVGLKDNDLVGIYVEATET